MTPTYIVRNTRRYTWFQLIQNKSHGSERAPVRQTACLKFDSSAHETNKKGRLKWVRGYTADRDTPETTGIITCVRCSGTPAVWLMPDDSHMVASILISILMRASDLGSDFAPKLGFIFMGNFGPQSLNEQKTYPDRLWSVNDAEFCPS